MIDVKQMIELAPYMQEKLQVWDKYVDSNGKTTLNMAEYMEHRKKCAEIAKMKGLKKAAVKKNKKKI